MIGAVLFQLKVVRPGILKETQGRFLHAAFFQMLNSYNEELAASVHANVRFKPFTVSRLIPLVPEKKKSSPFVKTGTKFFWRVTALREELLQAVCTVEEGYEVQAGTVTMAVERVIMSRQGHEAAGILDEEELVASCRAVDRVRSITFSFLSPVSFRSFLDDYPFPLPQLIFSSLADKWNLAGMPYAFDREQVREIATRLLPTAWKGQTQQVYLKDDRGVTGFTGEYTFKTDMLPLEDQQMLLILAQFAFFSGVGRLTGQGLGQTLVSFR